jgi:hypothetical protein
VVHEHLVILVDSSRVVQQFLEVPDVLFQHSCDLLKLGELVTVVVFKHATWAH